MGKIKLRVMNLGYVITVDYTYKFSDETTGFVKSYDTTHLLLV